MRTTTEVQAAAARWTCSSRSARADRRISLIAKLSPPFLGLARWMVPKPPLPTCPVRSYASQHEPGRQYPWPKLASSTACPPPWTDHACS
eukprot:scaffold57702_cov27-Tisochrysis_lutea.AAC.1